MDWSNLLLGVLNAVLLQLGSDELCWAPAVKDGPSIIILEPTRASYFNVPTATATTVSSSAASGMPFGARVFFNFFSGWSLLVLLAVALLAFGSFWYRIERVLAAQQAASPPPSPKPKPTYRDNYMQADLPPPPKPEPIYRDNYMQADLPPPVAHSPPPNSGPSTITPSVPSSSKPQSALQHKQTSTFTAPTDTFEPSLNTLGQRNNPFAPPAPTESNRPIAPLPKRPASGLPPVSPAAHAGSATPAPSFTGMPSQAQNGATVTFNPFLNTTVPAFPPTSQTAPTPSTSLFTTPAENAFTKFMRAPVGQDTAPAPSPNKDASVWPSFPSVGKRDETTGTSAQPTAEAETSNGKGKANRLDFNFGQAQRQQNGFGPKRDMDGTMDATPKGRTANEQAEASNGSGKEKTLFDFLDPFAARPKWSEPEGVGKTQEKGEPLFPPKAGTQGPMNLFGRDLARNTTANKRLEMNKIFTERPPPRGAPRDWKAAAPSENREKKADEEKIDAELETVEDENVETHEDNKVDEEEKADEEKTIDKEKTIDEEKTTDEEKISQEKKTVVEEMDPNTIDEKKMANAEAEPEPEMIVGEEETDEEKKEGINPAARDAPKQPEAAAASEPKKQDNGNGMMASSWAPREESETAVKYPRRQMPPAGAPKGPSKKAKSANGSTAINNSPNTPTASPSQARPGNQQNGHQQNGGNQQNGGAYQQNGYQQNGVGQNGNGTRAPRFGKRR